MAEGNRVQRVRRVLTWVLALVLVLAVAASVWIALNPADPADPFTEFYVLGPNGTAAGYPTDLSVGERATVIVGITNQESERVTYTVVARLGNRVLTTRTTTLADGRTWERPVSFAPRSPGRQGLRLLLYRGTDPAPAAEPYRNLRVWVNASGTNRSVPESKKRLKNSLWH